MNIDDIAYEIYVKICKKEYADEHNYADEHGIGYLIYCEKEFFLEHKNDGRWIYFYEQARLFLRYVKIQKILNGNR